MPNKLDINTFKQIALDKGGECISENYTRITAPLKFKCSKGHCWEVVAQNIKKGTWCPKCAGRNKGIEDCIEFALSKNGKCLSSSFNKYSDKIKWECKNNHIWEASVTQVLTKGHWCPKCSHALIGQKTKLSKEEINERLRKRGFEILTTNITNTQQRADFQCFKGHKWTAVLANVLTRTGCPHCSGSIFDFEKLKQIALKKGGKCLSSVYINSSTKLSWKCSEGHQWEATSNMIQKGTWCPVCSQLLTERICRKYFETIFGVKFDKIRPKWLLNDRGNQMELDGYNDDLKIAFEYNGIQHYKEHSVFHKKNSLKQRVQDDKLKIELCKIKGIKLFVLPYTVPINLFSSEIKKQSVELNVTPLFNYDIEIDINELASNNYLESAKSIAKERGGELLTEVIHFKKESIRLKCKEGHEWKTSLERIESGAWCLKCSGSAKYEYSFVKEKVEENGEYELLSKDYIKSDNKLKVLHKKCGREIEVKFVGWLTGYRCKFCSMKEAGKKNSIPYEEVKKTIEENGDYELLSSEYVNANTPLEILHKKCGNIQGIKLSKWKSRGQRCKKCNGRGY